MSLHTTIHNVIVRHAADTDSVRKNDLELHHTCDPLYASSLNRFCATYGSSNQYHHHIIHVTVNIESIITILKYTLVVIVCKMGALWLICMSQLLVMCLILRHIWRRELFGEFIHMRGQITFKIEQLKYANIRQTPFGMCDSCFHIRSQHSRIFHCYRIKSTVRSANDLSYITYTYSLEWIPMCVTYFHKNCCWHDLLASV